RLGQRVSAGDRGEEKDGVFNRFRWERAVFTGFRRSLTACCSRGLLDPRGELLDEVVDAAVFLDQLRDLRGRVDHGRVVAAAELLPDLGERAVRELAAQVHRDLARVDDRLRATVA